MDAQSLDPEDILQEVWATALHKFDSFEDRGDGSFYAWLVGILRHKLQHASREAQRPAVKFAESRLERPDSGDKSRAGLLAAIQETQTSVSSRVGNRELEERVMATLDQISETMREILLLRIYEAHTGRETAELLGIHESTVSVRLRQALEQCTKLMGTPGRSEL